MNKMSAFTCSDITKQDILCEMQYVQISWVPSTKSDSKENQSIGLVLFHTNPHEALIYNIAAYFYFIDQSINLDNSFCDDAHVNSVVESICDYLSEELLTSDFTQILITLGTEKYKQMLESLLDYAKANLVASVSFKEITTLNELSSYNTKAIMEIEWFEDCVQNPYTEIYFRGQKINMNSLFLSSQAVVLDLINRVLFLLKNGYYNSVHEMNTILQEISVSNDLRKKILQHLIINYEIFTTFTTDDIVAAVKQMVNHFTSKI